MLTYRITTKAFPCRISQQVEEKRQYYPECTAAVLLLDVAPAHTSHKVVKEVLPRYKNIAVSWIPGKLTPKLQPLDISFFGPLKKHLEMRGGNYISDMDRQIYRDNTPAVAPYKFQKSMNKRSLIEKNIDDFLPGFIEKIKPLKIQTGWKTAARAGFSELCGFHNSDGGRIHPSFLLQKYMRRAEYWPEFCESARVLEGSHRPLRKRRVEELRKLCEENCLRRGGRQVNIIAKT